MNIANQSFPNFRTDLNNALAALVSNSSSATEPTTTFAHQFWVDTASDPSVLKIRNSANDVWITIGQIDETNDKFTLRCDNATILENLTLNAQGDLRFADSDSSNYVAFQAPSTVASNVTWTLPSADGSSGQALVTNGSGTLSWAATVTDKIEEGDSKVEVVDTGTGSVTTTVDNVEFIKTTAAGTVINETGADHDVRIEGDTDANLLYVDAGADRVGIGTSSPGATLTVAHASGVDGRGIRLVNSSNSQTWETRIGVEGLENTSYAIKDITAGSVGMLINSSGNMLVGGSSTDVSTARMAVMGSGGLAVQYAGSSGTLLQITPAAANGVVNIKADARSGDYPPLTFSTAATERMRIDSSGNLLVGTTAFSYRFVAVTDANARTAYIRNAYGSGYTDSVLIVEATTAAGTGHKLIDLYSNETRQFYVRGDGTIYAQNTTVQSISDIRTKENIRTSEEGLGVISALRPVRFDFKEGFGNNRKNQLGFVAQEVEAVFPDAVSDFDQDGETYKSVGPGALIPILVKAIQELKAENDALKARLDAAGL
jgi:hypothetical protein